MKLRIEQDQDAQSPSEFDDTIYIVAKHRQFAVHRPGKRDTTYGEAFDVAAEIEDRKETHYVFLLEAYIHSGVVLALAREGNFPDREWDVSLLGAVFVDKTEADDKDEARSMARSKIDEWNQYLSGDVWGYIIEDDNGNQIDSCWGFYGKEYVEEQGQEALQYAIKHGFDPVI